MTSTCNSSSCTTWGSEGYRSRAPLAAAPMRARCGDGAAAAGAGKPAVCCVGAMLERHPTPLEAEDARDEIAQQVATTRRDGSHYDDFRDTADEVQVGQSPLDDADDDQRDEGQRQRDRQSRA